ncbi:MAG TPA: hypothetical protein VM554_12945 [Acidisarcina sp.]|nr:hypothetical protein [Acidisarcina sp.]
MQVLTFDVTPDRLERIREAMAARGFRLEGTEGDICGYGARVHYAYVAPALTITVRSAPVFHSLDAFAAQIHDAIAAVE